MAHFFFKESSGELVWRVPTFLACVPDTFSTHHEACMSVHSFPFFFYKMPRTSTGGTDDGHYSQWRPLVRRTISPDRLSAVTE